VTVVVVDVHEPATNATATMRRTRRARMTRTLHLTPDRRKRADEAGLAISGRLVGLRSPSASREGGDADVGRDAATAGAP
jgi:hypothetical protein